MFKRRKKDKQGYVDIRFIFDREDHTHDYGEIGTSRWSTYTLRSIKRAEVCLPTAELEKLSALLASQQCQSSIPVILASAVKTDAEYRLG